MCSNARPTGIPHVGIVLYVAFGIASLMLLTSDVGALPISSFFPYNATYGDAQTEATDDGGSGPIFIQTLFPFFNRSHNQIYVNNNGIISFLSELKTWSPENFPLNTETPVIAPFWADVHVQIGGEVWYRQSTDAKILDQATREIITYFPALRKFRANWVFISTWDDVGFYGATNEGKKKRNTFQAVLITDGYLSFVIFNYNKIQWTTGSNSGGDPETGRGGKPAQAGFNAGDKITYEEIPGARKEAVLNLTLTSNVDVPGKWVFRVDSATIQGSCSTSGSGKLGILPSSGVMLGGEKIELYGPCFYEEDQLLGRFDELNITFPCWFGSKVHAECVTPTVFRTGPLNISLNIDNSGWNFTGTFISNNIVDVIPKVKRVDPKNWYINQPVSISWDSDLIPSNNISVELLEYKNVNGIPSLRRVVNYTNIQQTRRSQFPFKLQNFTNLGVIRVSYQANSSNGSMVSIWSDPFPAKWNQDSHSIDWCQKWIGQEENVKVNLTQTEACPCTRDQADGDTGRYRPDPFCNQRSKVPSESSCLYRGGAKDCIILNYQESSEGSQLCCYGDDGELLHVRDGNGGGTLGKYHFRSQSENAVPYFSYYEKDLLPYLHCCQYANKNSLCLDYLNFRPAVTCDGYSPPAAAQAAGDPHLVTLDGKGYTFNGEGSFVLMEDVNSSVVIQVRAQRARDINGDLQNATLFTTVAMTCERHVRDPLEIQLDKDDIVKFLSKGRPLDLSSSTSEVNGLTVIRNDTSNSTSEVTVVMGTTGISVLIQVTRDLLNVMVTVGSQALKGNLRGLLGNYNGNATDDFMSRNGTLVVDTSMRAIHYDFGMTWAVTPHENILTPDVSESSSDDVLEPVFIDDIGSELRNDTQEVCGDNEQCIFDYQVTGNEDIAKSTKDFNQRFEERIRDLKPVVRCPYLEPITNGNRTVSGLTIGSTALFWCDAGFELIGASQLQCRDDGTWSGRAPRCGQKIVVDGSKDEVTAYIAAGASAGSIFLVIIVIVVVCRCRSPRKRKQKLSEEGSTQEDIPLPNIFSPSSHIPTTVFDNDYFMQSLNKLADTGSFRIPRPTYVDPTIFEEYF